MRKQVVTNGSMLSKITSHSNPKIKEVVKLRDGKERRRTGRFLIDGFREIARAFQSGIRILEIFVVESTVESISDGFPATLSDCSSYVVSEAVGEKIAFGLDNKVKQAMPAKKRQHVIEKADPRRRAGVTAAIKAKLYQYLCFICLSL